MKKKIGKHENMKLVDRIILDGIVGDVKTNDLNESTIGIRDIVKRVTFKGEEIIAEGEGFPLTKKMEEKIGWGKTYASVRFVTGDAPIDPTKVEESIIQSYYGGITSDYHHRVSDLSGYLWTVEKFIVGGHDIPKMLESFRDKYIHMEIEMYEEKNN